MILTMSFLLALAGVGFAGTAAFLPDTGIDGTRGAHLALLGATAVMLALGLLAATNVSGGLRAALIVAAVIGAVLTATAAWFLMQNVLAALMAAAGLAALAGFGNNDRKAAQ